MGRSGGGRSGGGFGGGFSGGGRSFGGFSGGGGRGRSGGRSGGFGGFGRGPRPMGPPPRGYHTGGGFWPFMVGYGIGRGSRGGGGGPAGPSPQGSGCSFGGCLGIIVMLIVLSMLFSLLSGAMSCSAESLSAPSSTVEREALPAGAASDDAGYYTDADGSWIYDSATLERGLRAFQDETGVAPYVYILPNGAETSVSALGQMANQLYDELFDDEAHFLLVFCDDNHGSFNCGYAVGSQAKTVMDDEAIGILADYLDRYYQEADTEEEVFADAFESTGERIMHVTTSPLVYIAVCAAIVAVAALVYLGVKRYRASKEREAERMQEVLNTPLETFGDQDLEDLERKYGKDPGDDEGPFS